MKESSSQRWVISIVLMLLVIGGLAAFKAQEIMGAIAFAQSFPEPSAAVEMHVVDNARYQPMQKVFAEVIAPRRLALRNELGGIVESIGFESGATVSKGQLLLQLDVREEQARLNALQARLTLASTTYKRNQTLFQQRRISEQTLDESRAEFESVGAELAQIKVQIDKKSITAPFDARAGIHHLEPGELLPAQSTVTTLVGLTPHLWVDFELPQAAPLLNVGDEITLLAKAERLKATVIAREGELSDSSRNLRYRAKFSADGHDLLPHSVVHVQVPAGESVEAALIPDTALRVDQLGNFVYLLEEDKESGALRARRQQVEVGSRRKNEVAILSGLSPGDRIAAKGAFKLRDNVKVSVKQPNIAEPQS